MTIADKVYEKLLRADPQVAQEVLDFLEFLEQKRISQTNANTAQDLWERSIGVLKDSKTFSGDPVEIQRKLRDEWD